MKATFLLLVEGPTAYTFGWGNSDDTHVGADGAGKRRRSRAKFSSRIFLSRWGCRRSHPRCHPVCTVLDADSPGISS